MTKHIPLTQGMVAAVDDSDYEYLSQWDWHTSGSPHSGKYYAVRWERGLLFSHHVFMHKVLLGAGDNEVVDHINGNSLDNRRSNLRRCKQYQDARNKSKSRNNASGFKGVTWDKSCNKWKAKICVNYETINLGRFDTDVEAAKAYDRAAKKRFGKFAKTNF